MEENSKKLLYMSEALIPKDFGWHYIKESETTGLPSLIVEGEFQRAEAPNKNKRIYAETLLQRETDSLVQAIEESNGLPMSMDHPIPGDTNEAMHLIQRVGMGDGCALIRNLEMNNKIVYGKAEVLEGDGQEGDKLANYVKRNYKIGVSSRGVGGQPIAQGDYFYVPENFKMLTYDVVSTPSNYNSRLQRYNESVDEFLDYYSKKKPKKTVWQVLADLSKE